MFVWNSFTFSMIQRMLAIWSHVPLPFLKPAWNRLLKIVRCYIKYYIFINVLHILVTFLFLISKLFGCIFSALIIATFHKFFLSTWKFMYHRLNLCFYVCLFGLQFFFIFQFCTFLIFDLTMFYFVSIHILPLLILTL